MGLDMYLRAQTNMPDDRARMLGDRDYIGGYSFVDEEERTLYRNLVQEFGVSDFVDPDSPSIHIEPESGEIQFTVGYWRKANQIHAWFVEHVQGGVDECQETEVSREQLQELRDLCEKVLYSTKLVPGMVHTGTLYEGNGPVECFEEGNIAEDSRKARELLPTQAGFFFGSTDYDEWYFDDLRSTIKQIDRALQAPEHFTFVYQSSW